MAAQLAPFPIHTYQPYRIYGSDVGLHSVRFRLGSPALSAVREDLHSQFAKVATDRYKAYEWHFNQESLAGPYKFSVLNSQYKTSIPVVTLVSSKQADTILEEMKGKCPNGAGTLVAKSLAFRYFCRSDEQTDSYRPLLEFPLLGEAKENKTRSSSLHPGADVGTSV